VNNGPDMIVLQPSAFFEDTDVQFLQVAYVSAVT